MGVQRSFARSWAACALVESGDVSCFTPTGQAADPIARERKRAKFAPLATAVEPRAIFDLAKFGRQAIHSRQIVREEVGDPRLRGQFWFGFGNRL
jgi:hypothetical protein